MDGARETTSYCDLAMLDVKPEPGSLQFETWSFVNGHEDIKVQDTTEIPQLSRIDIAPANTCSAQLPGDQALYDNANCMISAEPEIQHADRPDVTTQCKQEPVSAADDVRVERHSPEQTDIYLSRYENVSVQRWQVLLHRLTDEQISMHTHRCGVSQTQQVVPAAEFIEAHHEQHGSNRDIATDVMQNGCVIQSTDATDVMITAAPSTAVKYKPPIIISLPEGYKCSECGKLFSAKTGIRRHIQLQHDPAFTFSCNVCGLKVRGKSNLAVHMRVHSSQTRYTCEVCGKKYKWKQGYLYHMELHRVQGKRSHECKVCGKMYTTSVALHLHSKRHKSSMKLHKCDKCPYASAMPGDLKRHVKSHSDERNFDCGICQKKLKSSGNLKRHMETHSASNEKIFSCDICDRKYPRIASLRAHVLSHDLSTWRQCSLCEKRFATQSEVKSHMVTHTGDKNHECSVCNKRYTLLSNLKRHVRDAHKKTGTNETQ